ncbi:MAG TPA: hypothetical protein VG323_09540, partial [Thermoanaerobaculia bacterium]|nr:hypothetical protein [Thermoanaerobaculia bacterium]
PPLMAWTGDDRQTHIAPIDAPDRGIALPRSDVMSMRCNATACLAQTRDALLLLGLDATVIQQKTPAAAVLAADPGGFLVAAPALQRIDNNGATTFSTTLPPSLQLFDAAADFDGSQYVLICLRSGTSTLAAVSVSLRGEIGDSVTIAELPAGWSAWGGIAVAHAAGRHLVAYTVVTATLGIDPPHIDATRVDAIRLDDALHPLDAAPLRVNDTPWAELYPVIAPSSDGFLVAWSHVPGPFGSFDPETARVDANGHVSARTLVSSGLVPQNASSAASLPGALLLAWLENPQEDGAGTLRARRFGSDGTPLDAAVTIVAADARESAMAAHDSDALIVWRAFDYSVHAAILHADDTLQPVALPALVGAPSVAANRDGWMIAVAESGHLDLVRVDANGSARPPQTLVSIDDIRAAIASDGDRFLVVWATAVGVGTTLCNFQPCGTRAELLDATGGVIAGGIQVSDDHDYPVAAFAGGEYLVVSGAASLRMNRNGVGIGPADVRSGYGLRLASFGSAVLAAVRDTDGIHLSVIDHGIRTNEAVVAGTNGYAIALAPNGIAYNVDVNGTTGVAFRQIIPARRRASYH